MVIKQPPGSVSAKQFSPCRLSDLGVSVLKLLRKTPPLRHREHRVSFFPTRFLRLIAHLVSHGFRNQQPIRRRTRRTILVVQLDDRPNRRTTALAPITEASVARFVTWSDSCGTRFPTGTHAPAFDIFQLACGQSFLRFRQVFDLGTLLCSGLDGLFRHD